MQLNYEIESLVVEPCFTSFQPVFGVSTSVVHRPDLNLEKQNLLPGANSVCEVEEWFVCEADSGELEATSGNRKANPTQSVRQGSICKVDIGGKPGNGFCQLMMKIGRAAQSTGWIVSSQCRVQAAQSTGWIVSSQRQFFRSWEGPGTGGQVVAAPWATCPPEGWDLNLNQLCARPGMGDRSAKSSCMLIVLLQSMRVEMYYQQSMRAETYYYRPCSSLCSPYSSLCRCRDVPKEILVEKDATMEILEEQDVPEEILEEQKERSHADPTTTLVWVGLWQSLTGLIPTHITCIQSPMWVNYVTNL